MPPASLRQLFQFLSWSEVGVLSVGLLCEFVGGVGNPLMLIPMNDMFKGLGATSSISGSIVDPDLIERVLFVFVYIGAGLFAARQIGVPSAFPAAVVSPATGLQNQFPNYLL